MRKRWCVIVYGELPILNTTIYCRWKWSAHLFGWVESLFGDCRGYDVVENE